MAKNDFDNREALARVAVRKYTHEELVNSAVGALMEHYFEYDDAFHEDWRRYVQNDERPILVVGDHGSGRKLVEILCSEETDAEDEG